MSLNVELLESSFEQIKPCAGDFATSFYENLFSANPEAKPLFASTDLAEQKKKLVASLILVVENLRKPDVLEGALKGLGARHVQYGALPEHYPLVGSAILTTFEQYLGEDWTDEVKQAWVEAYGAITELMLSGADYDSKVVELNSEAAAEPDATEETSSEAALETTEPETSEEVPTEPEESGLKVSLLENSFEQIKPRAGEFAASFYENLFRMYPEAQPLFTNTDLAEQQKKLVASLVLVVENLRKPDALENPLKGLGARHVQYGALPEHYPLVGNALLTTLEQYLGDDWTPQVKQAWVEAYGAITELMLSGADYDSKVVELDSVAATEAEVNDTPTETPDTPIAQTVTEPVAAVELNSTTPPLTLPKTPTVAEVAPAKPIEQPPSSMNFALFSGVFGSVGTIAIILLLLA